MNQLKTDINKIKKILNADYDHERPDVIRSKKFGRAFATMIKHMFPDCEIIQSNCYCEASGFIKKPNVKIIYYSSEDYRWPIMGRTWTSSVLYRTAESEKDYHGGSNNFSDLEHFKENVEKLFERMV